MLEVIEQQALTELVPTANKRERIVVLENYAQRGQAPNSPKNSSQNE